MIRTIKLPVSRTAHLSARTTGTAPRFVWLATHGYGQLASQFIYKFTDLPEDHHIYAPEGLSKFYWKGVDGEPVASWMTRHQREDEIRDYLEYLDEVYSKHLLDKIEAGAKLVLFGFSQGGATLWRWLLHRQPACTAFINWATWPPEDVDYQRISGNYPRMIYVMGTDDPYFNKDRQSAFRRREHSWPFSFEWQEFRGGHEVDRDTLLNIARSLDRLPPA
jgi:predicted esterase